MHTRNYGLDRPYPSLGGFVLARQEVCIQTYLKPNIEAKVRNVFYGRTSVNVSFEEPRTDAFDFSGRLSRTRLHYPQQRILGVCVHGIL
jgi:hypothetical protein